MEKVMWNAMIDACADHGDAEKALHLFRKMKEIGISPNDYTFAAFLRAFARAGMAEETVFAYERMKTEYNFAPAISHQNCVVEGLARAGMLDRAKEFIEKEIKSPNMATWKALLGACEDARQLAVCEWAGEQALKLDPCDADTYFLLGSLYGEVRIMFLLLFLRKGLIA